MRRASRAACYAETFVTLKELLASMQPPAASRQMCEDAAAQVVQRHSRGFIIRVGRKRMVQSAARSQKLRREQRESTAVRQLARLLEAAPRLSEDELYRCSLVREPRKKKT